MHARLREQPDQWWLCETSDGRRFVERCARSAWAAAYAVNHYQPADQYTARASRLEAPLFDVIGDSSDREKWLAARATGAPASETAAILGADRHRSLIELWGIRKGRIESADLDDVEAVFWGNALEGAIIEGYAARTERRVAAFGLLCRSRAFPWMLATPDAFVSDTASEEDAKRLRQAIGLVKGSLKKNVGYDASLQRLHTCLAGWWPLQLKNVGMRMADEWENGAPHHYVIQTVHEAIVVGAEKATIAALIGGQQLAWQDVPLVPAGLRDDPHAPEGLLERQIVRSTKDFVESLMFDDPPRADASDSARRALITLYPIEDPGTIAQLGTELMISAQRADQIGAEIRALKAEKSAIENALRQAIKDAERGVFADGTGYSLKQITVGESVHPGYTTRKLTRFGLKRAKRRAEEDGTED